MHTPTLLPTPTQIVERMDRCVQGQERAKRDLAVAVYNHYIAQAHRDREGVDLGRYHVLLIGPTGVGKTCLIQTVAEMLAVPVRFASAAGLAEGSASSKSVESLIAGLVERAGGNPRRAEKGIVCIDEIDRVRRNNGDGGEAIQNALLSLLDGRISKGVEGSPHPAVDTGRLLFVCAGAFPGLDDIVRARVGERRAPMGFAARSDEDQAAIETQPHYRALCQLQMADLERFGMIPQFVGRFATVAALHELSRDALRQILGEGLEGSVLERQKALARIHGIELEFESKALDALAAEAERIGSGARGLDRLVGAAVNGVDYRWSELANDGVSKVIVGVDAVRDGAQPQIIRGEANSGRSDALLRHLALGRLPSAPAFLDGTGDPAPAGEPAPHWSAGELAGTIEATKRERLDWGQTIGGAREWWERFESQNAARPTVVLRLIEELAKRQATITDFFLAAVDSNTDDLEANLHFLDYRRLKERGRTLATPGSSPRACADTGGSQREMG